MARYFASRTANHEQCLTIIIQAYPRQTLLRLRQSDDITFERKTIYCFSFKSDVTLLLC